MIMREGGGFFMSAYLDIHYGVEAMRHLMTVDRALAPTIEKYGRVGAKRDPDIFAALVSAIVGDGISAANALAIEKRMIALCGEISVSGILSSNAASLKEIGLPQTKATTLIDLAEAVSGGRLDLQDTYHFDDAGYVDFLAGIKGVSRTAAETVAIFGEGRLDVFMYGGAAYQKAIMQIHGYTSYSRERHDRLGKLYSPYGTVATLYYLAIADELARAVAP